MRSRRSVYLVAFGAAALAAGAFALTTCGTLADDEVAVAGELQVTEISATAAQAGERTVLTFLIENRGTEAVRIIGARLPSGEPSRVMGAFGAVSAGEIEALRVEPDATEHLDGRRVWIEIGPLTRDLEANTVVSARLLLGTYEAPVAIHVVPGSTFSLSTGSVRVEIPDRGTNGC